MELIRQWAPTFCISAIMTSILKGVLPEKGAFSGIKLVLTLYILITLLSPLKSFSISQIDLQIETQPVILSQQNTDQAILNQAQERLEEIVLQALEREGISVTAVQLTLMLQQDNNVKVDTVRVTLAQGQQDIPKIEQVISDVLGCSVQVDIVTGNGMDEGR